LNGQSYFCFRFRDPHIAARRVLFSQSRILFVCAIIASSRSSLIYPGGSLLLLLG
jgi:hypothetical protein